MKGVERDGFVALVVDRRRVAAMPEPAFVCRAGDLPEEFGARLRGDRPIEPTRAPLIVDGKAEANVRWYTSSGAPARVARCERRRNVDGPHL
jgi:hypothetical protein